MIFFETSESGNAWNYQYYFIINRNWSGGTIDGIAQSNYEPNHDPIEAQIDSVLSCGGFVKIEPDAKSIEVCKKVLAKTTPEILFKGMKYLRELEL
jgi:hypothetical protein